MLNLRGASPVGRGEGVGDSYVARAVGRRGSNRCREILERRCRGEIIQRAGVVDILQQTGRVQRAGDSDQTGRVRDRGG